MKGNLQSVGTDAMLIIPSALLETADLTPGMEVSLTAETGSIVIRSRSARRYSLNELILECDLSQPEGNREWVDAPAAGDELI